MGTVNFDGWQSLSDIKLQPLEADAEPSRGYMGRDEFAVVETSLVRGFPVYSLPWRSIIERIEKDNPEAILAET